MKTLALIPARAGSRGIVGKNLRPFLGVPLMYKALAIGQQTCSDARITTNLRHVEGAMILRRPDELAQDETPMFDVVKHALDYFLEHPGLGIYPDAIVLLQPTQPLRTKGHVVEALRLLEETSADSVVSVVQIPAHYSPEYALYLRPENRLGPWLEGFGRRIDSMPTRRQDTSEAYSRDGTVYAIKRQTIEAGSLYGSHCVPLIIPSHESVNLDTEDDWIRAEAMVANG